MIKGLSGIAGISILEDTAVRKFRQAVLLFKVSNI